MRANYLSLNLCIWCSLILSGCTGAVYTNPYSTEPAVATTKWQSQDVQMTTIKMVDSLLKSPTIANCKRPPLVRFSGIVNKTTQHIDTKRLSDRIRVYLLKSGKVRLLTNIDDEQMQRNYGAAEARLSKTSIVNKKYRRSRKYKTSRYHLYGEISEIQSDSSFSHARSYQITLNLYDYQTDEIVWSDIQDIEKVQSKSIF